MTRLSCRSANDSGPITPNLVFVSVSRARRQLLGYSPWRHLNHDAAKGHLSEAEPSFEADDTGVITLCVNGFPINCGGG